ncbi:uncharacterized protein LOC124924012 [Impatiens glandulifera]|uniref:uncharacterized protein LOC124924012 n=1 Tax=Impatiens glandulifera TaxID=253017 RepID=UPI001FB1A184|nr:uncharacterized protein LOC124924012 [Impatiens glandulifera]
MAPAVPVHVWIPEDDLLLKNAVEEGASLEALAKGAVQFSQQFTLKELQDRWLSLLYDADIAFEASVRMAEIEVSASHTPLKFSRSDKDGGTIRGHKKRRRVGSIRSQYYAMRKKMRSELLVSPNLEFSETILRICDSNGGVYPGNEELDTENQPLRESDIDILCQAFPQVMADVNHDDAFPSNLVTDDDANRMALDNPLDGYTEVGSSFPDKEPIAPPQLMPDRKLFQEDNLEAKPSASESMENKLQNDVTEIGETLVDSHTVEAKDPLHPTGLSSPQCSLPVWNAMVDVSAPAMPVTVNPGSERHSAKDAAVLHDNVKGISSQCGDEINCLTTSTATTEGENADISDSLLDFSNDTDILFMDVKDKVDTSLLNSPEDVIMGGPSRVESDLVSSNVVMTADSTCPPDTELSSIIDNQDNTCQPEDNMTSTLELKYKTILFNERHMHCILNTEDSVIPCNDDIFLLIHPVASFSSSGAKSCNTSGIGPISSPNKKDSSQGTNLTQKCEDPDPFMSSMALTTNVLVEVTPLQTFYDSSLMSDSPDKSCAPAISQHATVIEPLNQCRLAHLAPNVASESKQVKNVEKIVSGVTVPPLVSEVAPDELTIPNPSSSDQEELESDDDIPGFSDIESMILDMDLGSNDQDSHFTRQVSRYQHAESKRRIMRLEQCAQSSLQRSMESQSALAIFYGHRSKYFIRKTEVLLGRPTEDVDVDINLAQEGNANKISRRQAIIKMDKDGSFYLKNLGKSLITVNGREVVSGQLINLRPSCLVEIRGLSFVFEINQKYVKRHLKNSNVNQVTKKEWK